MELHQDDTCLPSSHLTIIKNKTKQNQTNMGNNLIDHPTVVSVDNL